MRLYVMRHGETQWNIERKLQGSTDIPLNENGRELARITAEALVDVPFSRIYTSPLIRAKETAYIMKGNRDIPVIEDNRIREMCFGICEGHRCLGEDSDLPDPEFAKFFTSPGEYVPTKGAESIEALCERGVSLYHELIQDPLLQNDTILVSTHGAALRGFLSEVYQHTKAEFWKGGVYKNCAVTIVEVHDQKAQIIEEAKIYYNN